MARFLFATASEMVGPRVTELLRETGAFVDVVNDPVLARSLVTRIEYDGVLFDLDLLARDERWAPWAAPAPWGDRIPYAVVHGSVVGADPHAGKVPAAAWHLDRMTWTAGIFTETVLQIAGEMLRARVERLRSDLEPRQGAPFAGASASWPDVQAFRRFFRAPCTDERMPPTRCHEARSPWEAVQLLAGAVEDWSELLHPPRLKPSNGILLDPQGLAADVRVARRHALAGDEALRLQASEMDPAGAAAVYLALVTTQHGWRWQRASEPVLLTVEAPRDVRQRHFEYHALDGPALRYRDGWAVYAWQGHILLPRFVEDPDSIDAPDVRSVVNVELRRHLRELMGEDRYLEACGAKILHVDSVPVDLLAAGGTQITRALLQDDEGRRVLVASDGSTRRVYYMEVPGTCDTCQEAYEALSGRPGVRTLIQA